MRGILHCVQDDCCFFSVILRRRNLKDPMAFSNNQQSLHCVGFLPLGRQASTPAYRQAGLPAVGGPAYWQAGLPTVGGADDQNDALTNVILNGSEGSPANLISNYHYCAWDSSLTLRMTAD